MKKVILHIGCEKTGTTSIQSFLANNRDRLLADHGIFFPLSLGNANHTKFAIYACDESRGLTRFLKKGEDIESFRNSLRDEFLEEVKSVDWSVLIISAEWLHPRVRTYEEFSRMKSFLEGVVDDIEVLMYVRPQNEMAVSLYSTSVKAGNYKPFSFPYVTKGGLPYYYDFYSIYRNWKSHFGAGKIKVKVFSPDFLYCGDVVKDFCNFLGVDNNFALPVIKDNQSLSEDGMALLRAFNFWTEIGNPDISKNVRKRILGKISEDFTGKFDIATTNEKKEFYNYFLESNAKLISEVKDDLGIVLKGL